MYSRMLLALAILAPWCIAGTPNRAARVEGESLQGKITIRPNAHLGKIDANIYGHFAEQAAIALGFCLHAPAANEQKYAGVQTRQFPGLFSGWVDYHGRIPL